MSQTIFPETRERLVEWESRPDVLGVIHVGSKGRGHGDKLSDDDLEVFLTDDSFARLAPEDCGDVLIEGEGDARRIVYDAQYLPLSDLARKARSPFDLDHWPYEQAPVLFDRDGRTAAAVQAVGTMSDAFRHERLEHASVDAWIAVHRATKTLKRGSTEAARLILGRGVRALSRVLFALERRWVPLDHWFEAELRTVPDPARVGRRLIETLATNRPEPLAAGIESLAERLTAEGLPQDRAARQARFFRLIHPSRADERARHGLF